MPATSPTPEATARDSRSSATAQRQALLILLIAVVLGSGLRFYRLGVEEMNRGEAAAWTAAVAPDLRSVFVASKALDPGKSGLYDLVLHLWIAQVGDQVGPMRSLSAFCGTLSIILLFLAVRAIMRSFDDPPDEALALMAAAFAALLYACNLRMITTDRIARMYPLMLTAIFAQLWCFARAHRQKSVATIVGAAILTDVAVACNFTAMFFFGAEALWLVYLGLVNNGRKRISHLSIWRPAGALMLAGLLFLPVGITDARIAISTMHAGILGAIAPQAPWWPLRAIQVLTGNAAFWTVTALAIFGGSARWRRAPLAIRFMLCWLLLPFALIEAVSYLITPLMVERYVLASLVAVLVIAAIGLAALPDGIIRYAAILLIVGQSLAHVRHHWRIPEDVQWREAARFAVDSLPAGQTIAVIPPAEPLMVLRYYLPADQRGVVVSADAHSSPEHREWQLHCGSEPILIVSTEVPRGSWPSIEACYPRLLAHLRLVDVRGR